MGQRSRQSVPDPSATIPTMGADALWDAARADLLDRAAAGDSKYERVATPAPASADDLRRWNSASGRWEATAEGVPDPTYVPSDTTTLQNPDVRFDFPDVVQDELPVPPPDRISTPLALAAALLLVVGFALAAFLGLG